MKKLLLSLLCFVIVSSVNSSPKIDFLNLSLKTELNPKLIKNAGSEALRLNLPVSIYIPNTAFIEAMDLEDGKIVYSVITNFAKPETGGFTAFYEDIISIYNLSSARIRYANGNVTDNSGEVLHISDRTSSKVILVPDWTYDRVMAFDFITGDLVDTAFIHSNNPNLQSPKHALQRSVSRILVADQISDVVQEYDTNGIFVRTFAPAGGVNNSVLDNIRGICFRPNGNLLVCNAGSGASVNTVQEFDTNGVFVNTFMSVNVNSPFSLLYRTGDILLGNSSGNPKVMKYDFSGAYINQFTSSTLSFVQQTMKNADGTVMVCEFSGTASGLKQFDSTGNLITTFTGVTGLRGVFRLNSGNYLVTNGSGLFEIDGTSGSLIRQIYVAANLQYLSVFDPNLITSVNNNSVPLKYKLYDNYPNPFNPVTTIKYEIPERAFITLKVYDNLGKVVATLQNGYQSSGTYELSFDGKNLSSGVYFYKFSAGDNVETRKMIMLK